MAEASEALQAKLAELGFEASPEEFVASLPAPVQACVSALKDLQGKHDELYAAFKKELAELEAKYEKQYAPLYTERAEIVAGTKAPKEGEAAAGGIPSFWQAVLLKCDTTGELVKEKDVEVLQHLKDIQCENLFDEDGASRGFKLKFFFEENPFFTNQVLEKSYLMMPDEDDVLEKAEATKIEWKAGKDVTVKVMKKKPSGKNKGGKPQMKTEKVDSFFNFFSPPEVPGEEDDVDHEEMEELQALIEADYEVGAMIREKLIPQAVLWFTGEAQEDEGFFMGDEDEDFEGEDGEDDEDEDEDDEPAPVKGKGGKGGKGGAAAAAAAAGQQPPECKQQ